MMKRFVASLSVVAIVFMASLSLVPATTVSAAVGKPCPNQNVFLPSWYDNMCVSETNPNIVSPNESSGSAETTGNNIGAWLAQIAINLVTLLLTVVGYVSLAYVIYGGFKYMTSGDNSSGTQAARKTITNALIGLVISIMAVAIVKFVTGVFG